MFDSFDEYQQAVSQSLERTEEERKAWEVSQGIVSFGTACDELYSDIESVGITTFSDLKEYVDNNSKYLQLIEEDGEFILETQMYNSSDRYISNLNGMYQINDTVYKDLENKTVAVLVDNIEILHQINESTELSRFSDFLVQGYNSIEDSYKDGDADIECGKKHKWWTTNGKNRTRVELKVYMRGYNVKFFAQVRPLKRSWGAWIHCKRTIDVNAVIGIEYAIKTPGYPDKWFSKEFTMKGKKHTSKFEKTWSDWTGDNNKLQHFSNYSIYADTPSTNAIIKNCN